VRAVLDTNVLLSGLFWRGTPHALIAQIHAGALTVISSPGLLAELAEVITVQNSRLYWTTPTPIQRRCLLTCGGWLR
jgi:predicted nucleic acid-binding protein